MLYQATEGDRVFEQLGTDKGLSGLGDFCIPLAFCSRSANPMKIVEGTA